MFCNNRSFDVWPFDYIRISRLFVVVSSFARFDVWPVWHRLPSLALQSHVCETQLIPLRKHDLWRNTDYSVFIEWVSYSWHHLAYRWLSDNKIFSAIALHWLSNCSRLDRNQVEWKMLNCFQIEWNDEPMIGLAFSQCVVCVGCAESERSFGCRPSQRHSNAWLRSWASLSRSTVTFGVIIGRLINNSWKSFTFSHSIDSKGKRKEK